MKSLLVLGVAIFSFQSFATTCNGDGVTVEVKEGAKKIIVTGDFNGEATISSSDAGEVIGSATKGNFNSIMISTLDGEVDIIDKSGRSAGIRIVDCD